MTMDRTVPVQTAVKCRREFAGRRDVSVALQGMRDMVGILLVDTGQRKPRKVSDLLRQHPTTTRQCDTDTEHHDPAIHGETATTSTSGTSAHAFVTHFYFCHDVAPS